VERRVSAAPQSPQSPQAPQAPVQQAATAAPAPAPGINDAGVPNNSSYDSLGVAAPTGPISSGPGPATIGSSTAPNVFGDPSQPFGSTPISGSSSLIPLGNGAYFDPTTGSVHYPTGMTAT